jgi:hypothetical protein
MAAIIETYPDLTFSKNEADFVYQKVKKVLPTKYSVFYIYFKVIHFSKMLGIS